MTIASALATQLKAEQADQFSADTALRSSIGTYLAAVRAAADNLEAAASAHADSTQAIRAAAGELVDLVAVLPDPVVTPPPVDPPPVDPEPAPLGLRWAAPTLTNPITINVTNANRNQNKLDPTKDYILVFTEVLTDTLTIFGGRNVVGRGIEIAIPGPLTNKRAIYLSGGTTGIIHLEGVKISGAGVADGLVSQQKAGATVQVQNYWCDKIVGSQATNHADIFQTWAGPAVLRLHNVTATSGYQGIFLRPNDTNAGHKDPTTECILSNVQIIQAAGSGYAFWHGIDGVPWPLIAENCWVTNPRSQDRTQVLWPKNEVDTVWNGVKFGTPPGGDFVTAADVGLAYTAA